MFDDGRSRKVVFVAHCFLNQNSISDGTAVYPAVFRELIEFFINAHVGIVQMPCPELCCLGLDRGNIHGANCPVTVENTRIRTEMKKDPADQKLTELAGYVVQQILEYHKSGFEILGIIGANRSPTCGVDTTSDHHEEIRGQGLFIEKISAQLSKENLLIPMIGLKGSDQIPEKLQQLLYRQHA